MADVSGPRVFLVIIIINIIIIIQYTADLLSNQAFAVKIREQQSKRGDSTMVMKKVIPWSEVV